MNNLAQNAVFCKRLDWNLTTTAVFSHFEDTPWAILLDSANANHIDARFDVICAEPVATIVTKADTTTINRSIDRSALFSINQPYSINNAKQSHSNDDPFSLVNALINEYYPVQKHSPFMFSGGVMGSFNYDLGRVIESLPQIAENDISLPEMNLGCYDWALIFYYQDNSWHLVHYSSNEALDILADRLSKLVSNTDTTDTAKPDIAKADTSGNIEPFILTSDWQNQLTEQAYKQKFASVQEYLLSGDCYQINLTQRFSAQYQGDEWQAYMALRETNGAPFSAFIRLEQHALLSISPERFIQHQNGDVQTKPIKGTMPRDTDPLNDLALAQQLKDSEKDRAENLMIVDLLRNDIGKVAAPGSVTVPKLFDVESFPAVHHLVSTVTAKLAPKLTPIDLLKACFPGGSITGAPKIRAMSIIEELEPSRRSLYCGSIGYISQDGTMDTSITIRTLVSEQTSSIQGSETKATDQQQKSGVIHCWAGGGIVADSKADAEYQESFDKVSRILPVLSKLNR
ncbi:aminodeoxychorismate synthase component I [Shewanella sp. 1CM18E]|uniref:aminodeoxychorismate synthase component I n=1 Tax=Shewanella sp. 1CM18E TaxID=2929169 RepID=UPI0020BD8A9B|nr:aminodeoxychorismate synthase component I [Shewanella sp. 1CM18E]MCK8046444.1 aminodeoxychorismate synthase component I [Shewanella sp. 1CM18E]